MHSSQILPEKWVLFIKCVCHKYHLSFTSQFSELQKL